MRWFLRWTDFCFAAIIGGVLTRPAQTGYSPALHWSDMAQTGSAAWNRPPSDPQKLYFAAVSVSAIHHYVVQPHYIIRFFKKQDEFFVFRCKKSAKNADFVFGLIFVPLSGFLPRLRQMLRYFR